MATKKKSNNILNKVDMRLHMAVSDPKKSEPISLTDAIENDRKAMHQRASVAKAAKSKAGKLFAKALMSVTEALHVNQLPEGKPKRKKPAASVIRDRFRHGLEGNTLTLTKWVVLDSSVQNAHALIVPDPFLSQGSYFDSKAAAQAVVTGKKLSAQKCTKKQRVGTRPVYKVAQVEITLTFSV